MTKVLVLVSMGRLAVFLPSGEVVYAGLTNTTPADVIAFCLAMGYTVDDGFEPVGVVTEVMLVKDDES